MPTPRPQPLADRPPAQPARHACPDGLAIREQAGGEALYAARAFEAGEPVFQLLRVTWRAEADGRTLPHPSGGHLFDPILARAGHALDPNCRVSVELMAAIARRAIAAGEPITIRAAGAEH